jgi:hypothetical protein
MRLGVLLAAGAAGALFATGALADPQTLTFTGTITNGIDLTTTYVASYVYDPSVGMLKTTSAPGGLVTTNFTGPVEATITFAGSSFTIDEDPNNPGQIQRSDETELNPPSVEYIANASSSTASLSNVIEVRGGVATFAFGSFVEFSGEDVIAEYALTPETVSAAPEASTWALMGAGVAALGLMLRRAKATLSGRSRPTLAV